MLDRKGRALALVAAAALAAAAAEGAAYGQQAGDAGGGGGDAGRPVCGAGMELLIRAATGSPACVAPATKTVLIERGWGLEPPAWRGSGGGAAAATGAGAGALPAAPVTGSAAAGGLTDAETAWLEDNPVIYVAYHDRPPIEHEGDDGFLLGLSGLYADHFKAFTGSDFVPVRLGGRAEFAEAFLDGRAHMAFSVVGTDPLHRHARVLNPHTLLTWDIVALDSLDVGGDARVGVGELHERNLAIGTIRSHEIEEWLDTHYPHVDYISIDTHERAFDALDSGRISVLIEAWAVAKHVAASHGVGGLRLLGTTGIEMPLAVSFSKDHPPLEGIVEKALAAMPDDVRSARTLEIIGGEPPGGPSGSGGGRGELTGAELAWLDANPSISLVYLQWPPIEYYGGDGRGGGLTGMYAERLSEFTGSEFVATPVESRAHLELLLSGDDPHVSMSMVKTEDLLRHFAFTDPHTVLEWNVITKGQQSVPHSSLPDLRVGTIRGSSIEAWLDTRHDGVDYVSIDSYDHALEALDTGRIDALIDSWPAIKLLAAERGIDGLYNAGKVDLAMPLSAAVSKHNQILRDIMNKAINAIPAEERAWMLAAVLDANLPG